MRSIFAFIISLSLLSTLSAQDRTIETWRVINETSLFRVSTFDIGFDYTRNFFYGGLSAGRMHNHQIDPTINSRDEYTLGNYAKLRVGFKSLPKPENKTFFGVFGELNLGYFGQKAFTRTTLANAGSVETYRDTYTRNGLVFSVPVGVSFNILDVGFDLGIRYNRLLADNYSFEGRMGSDIAAEDYFNGLRVPTPGYGFIDQGKGNNPDFQDALGEAVIDLDLFLRVHYTFEAFGFFYY